MREQKESHMQQNNTGFKFCASGNGLFDPKKGGDSNEEVLEVESGLERILRAFVSRKEFLLEIKNNNKQKTK